MLRRGTLLIARLTVLAALAGFSACQCAYTAAITNDTDSALFANISYDWKGKRYEEEGVLILPHGQTKLLWGSDAFLRVRDLSGNTVAFRYLPEGDDIGLTVSNLEPVYDPEPLGVPPGTGSEGLSTTWSSVICRDRHELKVPQYWMTITVHSNFDGPLMVSAFEPSSDQNGPDVGGKLRGVLVPPMGEGRLHFDVVEQGWLKAYEIGQDGASRLVFTKALPREPFPLVEIPSVLPPQPDPVPTLDFSRRTGFGTDCSFSSVPILEPMSIAIGIWPTAAVLMVVILAVALICWWWLRRPRRA
jgi:hypothetical protein